MAMVAHLKNCQRQNKIKNKNKIKITFSKMAEINFASFSGSKRLLYDQTVEIIRQQAASRGLSRKEVRNAIARLGQSVWRMEDIEVMRMRFHGGQETLARLALSNRESRQLFDLETLTSGIIEDNLRYDRARNIQRVARGFLTRRQTEPMLSNARETAAELRRNDQRVNAASSTLTGALRRYVDRRRNQRQRRPARDMDPSGYVDHDPTKGRFIFGIWTPFRRRDLAGPRPSATRITSIDEDEERADLTVAQQILAPARPTGATVAQQILGPAQATGTALLNRDVNIGNAYVPPDDSFGDNDGMNDLGADDQGPLQRNVAPANRWFGNATSDVTNYAAEGGVPIYSVDVDLDITSQDLEWEDAFHYAFVEARDALSDRQLNWASAYGQVRLVRLTTLQYDVVTPMVPINEMITEFGETMELALQSQDTDIRPHSEELHFRFTFVFPSGSAITPGIVTTAARMFRQQPNGGTLPLNTFTTTMRFNIMEENRANGTIHALNRRQLHRQVAQSFIMQQTPEQRRQHRQDLKRAREARNEPAVQRQRKALTKEQRDEYNKRRRLAYQAAHNQNDVRGIYDDLKRRIFHHTSLSQFFECSKSVLTIPNTHQEGYCLAMAILRSEVRTYNMESFEVQESSVGNAPGEDHLPFPIDPIYEDRLRALGPFPFLGEVDGVIHGFLFNAFRQRRSEEDSDLKYNSEVSDVELQAWYTTSQAFHSFVESRYDRLEVPNIDPNKEEAALQAYSNVLGVHIAVYRLELQGRRSTVYSPEYLSPDLRQRKKVYVVSILISDGHATCITNLREFLKNKATANRSNINNYCLFCEKLSTANNESLEKAKQHFKECCTENNGELLCQSDRIIKCKMVHNYNAVQFTYRAKYRDYLCRTCNQPVDDMGVQHEHVCYIKKPETLPMGKSEEVYVYDMECAQVYDAVNKVFDHRVNLVCVRRAYPIDGDLDRQFFYTIDDFMAYIMSKSEEKRIYIAHNGGRYDVQFVMRYLERNLIPHSFVPAPSSIHAYLSVTISFGASRDATFLDFRNFMPGSLKNIGVSFGLNVTKGTFPHHFNDGTNDFFDGCLPEIDNEKDYWCMASMRTEEEIDSFREWYAEQSEVFCTCEGICSCSKRKWNFREQILLYCWLDVDVLAEAVQKYRDNALSFGVGQDDESNWVSKGIDPFQYVTIPQMAVNLLLGGLPATENITITPPKRRVDRHPLAIAWMERLNNESGYSIKHIGNSNKEFFCLKTERYLDGVDIRRRQYFVCLDCEFHGCQECFYDESQSGTNHPVRPGTYSMVYEDTSKFVQKLMKHYGHDNVHITWTHSLEEYSPYEKALGHIMGERDMFYGGRTEVFSPYCNSDFFPEDDIKYHDVCSLYPYVCAFKQLPTGEPKHICGTSVDRSRVVDLNHARPYFGYVRCRVVPNRTDVLGLLPFRDPVTKRLDFPLLPMVGCWGTEELRLALENGYEVQDIYEVYHWTETERSDTALRGYVAFFLRMKQEAEGWRKLGASSEEPSEEEKDIIIEKVYEENGRIAKVRKECVVKNPVKRQMAKLFLNSLWGKFCQKPNKDNFVTIHGYKQFANLWYNPEIDRSKFSFRHLSGNTWKVKYSTLDSFTKPNVKYNIFLASKVTEWARCILHRQMIKIGPSRVLYCDTDSIMFLWPKSSPNLSGCGLGNWVDEYPREVIKKLYAISPKFYYLVFESGDNLLKSKGIQMTLQNAKNLKEEKLGKQLLELLYPRIDSEGNKLPFENYMYMKNMIIGVNSTNSRVAYGSMLTRYTEDKKVSPTFTKRNLVTFPQGATSLEGKRIEDVPRIFTIPKNYVVNVETLSNKLETSGFFLSLDTLF